jgi:hypothetical protein
MVGVDSILKIFFTYLKQYKFHFNYSIQHLKYVVLVSKTILAI